MDAPQEFARGDLVRWSSQGRGTAKHRTGVVVLVVPAGIHVASFLDSFANRYSLRALHRPGGPRADRSYLVAQVGGGGRGKARLHWPHASLLRPYHSKEPNNDPPDPL